MFQLRAEKEKFGQWKDQLEREKNEAFRQVSFKLLYIFDFMIIKLFTVSSSSSV